MHPDTAAILAEVPDDAIIYVGVRKGDWLRACEAKRGGPEYARPSEIARLVGYYTGRWWVDRAKAGKIAGAFQTEHGRWCLPLEACREHIRALRRKPTPASVDRPTLVRSVPRGPYDRTQRKAQ